MKKVFLLFLLSLLYWNFGTAQTSCTPNPACKAVCHTAKADAAPAHTAPAPASIDEADARVVLTAGLTASPTASAAANCDPTKCDLTKCDVSKCDPTKCDLSKCDPAQKCSPQKCAQKQGKTTRL